MTTHRFLKRLLLTGCALGATSAQASLVDLQNGLIYDTDSDLVWLQDVNTDGVKNWDQAMQWASDFSYDDGSGNSIGDWRLPTLTELAHLMGPELGGTVGTFLADTTPFNGFVLGGRYWTSTETVVDSQEHAFTINGKFEQGTQLKSRDNYAWAVRANNGLVAVPLPSMAWLFNGLLMALFWRRKFKA